MQGLNSIYDHRFDSDSDDENLMVNTSSKTKFNEVSKSSIEEPKNEFEKLMEFELNQNVDRMRPTNISSTSDSQIKQGDIFQETNENLFYDPDEDEKNEKWLSRNILPSNVKNNTGNNNIMKRTNKLKFEKRGETGEQNNEEREEHGMVRDLDKLRKNTDAILNCPCCMSLLSQDCQRHEVYTMQFRAMFVHNCRIDRENTLSVIPKQARRGRGKLVNQNQSEPSLLPTNSTPSQQKEKQQEKFESVEEKTSSTEIATAEQRELQSSADASQSDYCEFQLDALTSDNIFHPVVCDICATRVAVIDRHEIFHFFNVIASH